MKKRLLAALLILVMTVVLLSVTTLAVADDFPTAEKIAEVSFTVVDGAKTVSENARYGDSWASLVTIDKSKIEAVAGDTLQGEYTVNFTDKGTDVIPAVGDHPYTITFTGSGYTDIPVDALAGSVRVSQREIIVTAAHTLVRVGDDVEDVKGECDYLHTDLVGDDRLAGVPEYTFYTLNKDGSIGNSVALTESLLETPGTYAVVVSGLNVPNTNYNLIFSDLGRLKVRKRFFMPPVSFGYAREGMLTDENERIVWWEITKTGQIMLDAFFSELAPEEKVLVGCYDNDGRFVGVKWLDTQHATTQIDPTTPNVKLFWLGANQNPLSPSVTVWGK